MKKQSVVILSIPLTLFLGSCGSTSADIKAAQELAKLQGNAETLFPKIAYDVYQSCRRTADITLLNTPTPTSGEIDKDRQAAKEVCEGNPAAATKALKDANQVILDYLEALGKLVDNDLTNFDPELDSIGTSLQSLPGLNEGEKKEVVGAGTAIAKFLFRAATDGYRRKQLKEAVTTANAPLQTLVTALNKAVSKHYINGVLETEQLAVDNYYSYYLGRVLTAPQAESVSAQVDTETAKDQEWRNTNKTIEEKKVLAAGYLGLLKKIANDHDILTSMYVKGKTPSPTQAKQMVDGYSKELKSLVKKSEKLFPKS